MKNTVNNKVFALAIALSASTPSWALGGLDKAKTAAEDIKTGLYAVVGVVAIIYLIWMGVMAFAEKKSWADFGWAVIYVALVGASIAIGTWAWSLFL